MRSINIFAPFARCSLAATYPDCFRRAIMRPVADLRGPMTHTFLFEPGIWTASGTFWRGDGEPMEAQGRTEITHRPDCWLLSGTLKGFGSPPVEFVNAYRIEPPGRNPGAMKWTSEKATLA